MSEPREWDPLQVPYHEADGSLVGMVEIDPSLLGGRLRRRLMFDAVLRYEANRRRGTHKTRGRAEVAGSIKKMFRQKGTGNARAGSRRAPHRKGGGVAMGPQPRSYRQRMPRKARLRARDSALLSKFADLEAAVIESLSFESPSTGTLHRLLGRVLEHIEGQPGCLIAVTNEEGSRSLVLSARNLPRVAVRPISEVSAFDLLLHSHLLITREALAELLGEVQVNRSS